MPDTAPVSPVYTATAAALSVLASVVVAGTVSLVLTVVQSPVALKLGGCGLADAGDGINSDDATHFVGVTTAISSAAVMTSKAAASVPACCCRLADDGDGNTGDDAGGAVGMTKSIASGSMMKSAAAESFCVGSVSTGAGGTVGFGTLTTVVDVRRVATKDGGLAAVDVCTRVPAALDVGTGVVATVEVEVGVAADAPAASLENDDDPVVGPAPTAGAMPAMLPTLSARSGSASPVAAARCGTAGASTRLVWVDAAGGGGGTPGAPTGVVVRENGASGHVLCGGGPPITVVPAAGNGSDPAATSPSRSSRPHA